MKNRAGNILFSIAVCSLLLLQFYSPAHAGPIKEGAIFPHLTFQDSLTREESTYLEISRKKTFGFNDIKGTLIIVEVFNTFCTSCPRNINLLNHVYTAVDADRSMKQRVKIIAIAVGNTQNEVRDYKRSYKVQYPILTDYSFAAHKSLGNPRVPFTIFVKRDVKGKSRVVCTHMGLFESPDSVIKTIRSLAYY